MNARNPKKTSDNGEDRIEQLLEDLEPVELPPFFRSRLLARIRREADRPSLLAVFTGRNVGWSVAAVCAVALILVVVHFTAPTPGGTEALVADSGDATISPLMPVDSSYVGAGDVQILASIDPPIKGGLIRLFVDGRDVTGLAEVTESYIMYSPSEELTEGEHIVSIEIRDASGAVLRDVTWLFNAMDGGQKPLDERV